MNRCVHFLIAIVFLACLGNIAISWAETGEEGASPPHKDTGISPDKAVKELEKFGGDIQRWFSSKKEKGAHQFHDVLDLKVFQTHVFFGSAMAFFLVLVLLFISKFLFNIGRDALVSIANKVLSLMGRDTAAVREHHFAPFMTSGAARETKSISAAPNKKPRLMFCEVMTLFVNPLIKAESIHKALTEQKERNPQPKIGSLLIEHQVVSQHDVDKTLKLQQQYRSKK